MPRNLITASVVRRLAREQKSDLLVLGPADLITPEAADLARQLGVQVLREAPAAPQPAAGPPVRAASPGPPSPSLSSGNLQGRDGLPPLKAMRGLSVRLEAFGEQLAVSGPNVHLKDVITSADGSPMAAGYMTLDRGEFPWTLSYDEVDIVLEGELVITRGTEVVRAGPGDCLFIPKGSSITFGTPNHVRFVYVTFPADWS